MRVVSSVVNAILLLVCLGGTASTAGVISAPADFQLPTTLYNLDGLGLPANFTSPVVLDGLTIANRYNDEEQRLVYGTTSCVSGECLGKYFVQSVFWYLEFERPANGFGIYAVGAIEVISRFTLFLDGTQLGEPIDRTQWSLVDFDRGIWFLGWESLIQQIDQVEIRLNTSQTGAHVDDAIVSRVPSPPPLALLAIGAVAMAFRRRAASQGCRK